MTHTHTPLVYMSQEIRRHCVCVRTIQLLFVMGGGWEGLGLRGPDNNNVPNSRTLQQDNSWVYHHHKRLPHTHTHQIWGSTHTHTYTHVEREVPGGLITLTLYLGYIIYVYVCMYIGSRTPTDTLSEW